MTEDVKKIYNIDITATDALKTLADLKNMSVSLTAAREKEAEQNGRNTEEYYKLTTQIKAVNKEAATYEKQITSSIKLQNKQEQSLGRLRTQLSLDNAEFSKLGNTQADLARKDELGKTIAATTEEIKRQEEALGDHRRSVGDYAKAGRELKSEIKELSNAILEMAASGDTSSEAYRILISRVAELKRSQAQANNEINNTAKGTETIKALTGAVGGVTAGYGLLTAASAVLGTENEELEAVMKKMMTVITALNSLTAINTALSKTNATYRAAQNLVQLVGINQTKAETKALAAKNAMTTAGSVATKAATAATWLWNTALAANPIFLIVAALAALVVGIAALTGAFKSSSKESKNAAAAMNEYKRSIETTTEVIEGLNRAELRRARENEIALGREIEALKDRGATAQEIADAEYEAAQRQRKIEISYAKARLIERQQDYALAQVAIAAKEKEISTWDKSVSELKEAEEELKNLRSEAGKLYDLIQTDSFLVGKVGQDVVDAARDHAEAVKKSNKEAADAAKAAADKAFQAWMATHQDLQKIAEETYKVANTYRGNDLISQQAYEQGLFDIQQQGARERLDAQRKAGNITASEYQNQYKLLELQTETFNENQRLALNTHYKKVRDDMVSQLDKTVDQQIGEAVVKYNRAMEDIASMQAPVRVPGMSAEDYERMLKEYEEFIGNRAILEKELTRNLETEIQAIREASLAEQIKKFDDELEKQYGNDLAKYTDNERKKLQTQAEMLKKQIEQRKSVGENTNELEAQLRANALAQAGLDYSRDTILAGNNAKAKYAARKKYFEAELELAKGNADKELEISQALVDAQKELFEEQMALVEQYANAIGGIINSITDLVNTNSDAQKQKVELQHTEEAQALADKYARGLLTEAQYNAEKLRMETKKDKELAKIERQQAIRERAGKVFSVVTDTAAAVMSSFKNAGGFPLGIPMAAAMAAIGALNLATILSEPLPKAARGAHVKGRTHAQGGEQWELERGETVINAKSSSMFLPLLSAINEMGGGVPFTTIGSDGGYALRSAVASGPGISGADMNEAIQEAFSKITIITTVEDIRRADKEYTNIESSGTF